MNCLDCERPMDRGTPSPGHVRHQALGFCRCCYDRRRQPTRLRPVPNPMDRLDEVVVERALHGEYDGWIAPVERALAVAVGTRRGLSARRLAELLSCTPRTVHRHRRALVAA